MADLTIDTETAPATPENRRLSGRKPWSAPNVRALKTSGAENGPNFPTADGIEGQS